MAVGVAAALSVSAGAQDKKEEKTGDMLPDRVVITPFGGVRDFQSVQNPPLGTEHHTGGAFGARVTENFWKYVGLEQGYTYSPNNVTFLRPGRLGAPNYGFGNRVHEFNLNPVVYFTERGSRFRPYITAGASAVNFTPTDTAKALAGLPENVALFGAQGLSSKLYPGLNYGGGMRMHLSDRVGLNFDARGLWTRNPTYGLPDSPGATNGGVYIPRGNKLNGIMPTAGINFYLGPKYVPPPPAPPPAPKSLAGISAGSLSAGSGTLCPDRPISIRDAGAADPDGRPLTYKWKVNGQPVGGNSPELQWTPKAAGTYTIDLDVEAPNTDGMPIRTAKANPITLTVQEYKAPTVTGCSATPNALKYGDTSALASQAIGSPCSTLQWKWTASEGTLSNDTMMNAGFDSKSVQFQQGGKIQKKTVNITGTATDDRGATAKCDVPVTIDYIPPAIRFGDLVFSKNSARVNNCAKRILLEELAAKAADPDYDIVLVGHIDNDEVSKTKKASTLDKQRVMNAVAVLTAGKGTCGTVDASRIKADWVGTNQVSDMQPGLCGTSTRAAADERKASVVSTADQNRRVEVWLVPKGTEMPKSFTGAKDVPEKELKKLACPK
jgi:outer membrane protein OmpA-like peptidoglycan-associated protein